MELVMPSSPPMDFDFGSARSSPPSSFLSAPSSPRRFGQCFFSAPTSPTRMSEFYREYDEFSASMERSQSKGDGPPGPASAVPFDWEEKPGTPKSPKAVAVATAGFDESDFAFDVSVESEDASRSAEELFEGGKIRPLKPPPRLQFARIDEHVTLKSPLISSPRSPRSPMEQGKKFFRDAFSPRRKKQSDPFGIAVKNASQKTEHKTEQDRGRERNHASSGSNSGRRAVRSLSPFRVSEFPWEEEEKQQQHHQQQQEQSTKKSSSSSASSNQKVSLSSTSSSLSTSSSKGSSKKWSFRDFLLFRSASEGRASDKDPFRKYGALFKKHEDVKNASFRSTTDVKNASFRSTDSSAWAEASGSRRKGRVSAHELHYTANKAVSEDLKKKTFLPYKQGILGRLAFNPAVHALANGFGSLSR